jgi:hypothetical protein
VPRGINSKFFAPGVQSQQAFGPNPNRKALIVSGPSNVTALISFGGDAAANPDIEVALQGGPFVMTFDKDGAGHVVIGEPLINNINVCTLVAAQNLCVAEIYGS